MLSEINLGKRERISVYKDLQDFASLVMIYGKNIE